MEKESGVPRGGLKPLARPAMSVLLAAALAGCAGPDPVAEGPISPTPATPEPPPLAEPCPARAGFLHALGDGIETFSVSADGHLVPTAASPVATAFPIDSATLAPSGRILYGTGCSPDYDPLVGSGLSCAAQGWRIGDDGHIEEISGSPFTLTGILQSGPAGGALRINPSGRHAYSVAWRYGPYCPKPSLVHTYSVDPQTGAFTPLPGTTSVGSRSSGLVFGPSGTLALAGASGEWSSTWECPEGGITLYKVDDSTGALTFVPIPGGPEGTNLTTWSVKAVTTWEDRLLVRRCSTSGDGKGYATCGTETDTVDLYHIQGLDAPEPVSAPVSQTEILGTYHLPDLLVDPCGRFVFCGGVTYDGWEEDVGFIEVMAFQSDGTLKRLPGSPYPLPPAWDGLWHVQLAVDPGGRFLYAASYRRRAVAAWKIDQQTGALEPLPGFPLPISVRPTALLTSSQGGV